MSYYGYGTISSFFQFQTLNWQVSVAREEKNGKFMSLLSETKIRFNK